MITLAACEGGPIDPGDAFWKTTAPSEIKSAFDAAPTCAGKFQAVDAVVTNTGTAGPVVGTYPEATVTLTVASSSALSGADATESCFHGAAGDWAAGAARKLQYQVDFSWAAGAWNVADFKLLGVFVAPAAAPDPGAIPTRPSPAAGNDGPAASPAAAPPNTANVMVGAVSAVTRVTAGCNVDLRLHNATANQFKDGAFTLSGAGVSFWFDAFAPGADQTTSGLVGMTLEDSCTQLARRIQEHATGNSFSFCEMNNTSGDACKQMLAVLVDIDPKQLQSSIHSIASENRRIGADFSPPNTHVTLTVSPDGAALLCPDGSDVNPASSAKILAAALDADGVADAYSVTGACAEPAGFPINGWMSRAAAERSDPLIPQ